MTQFKNTITLTFSNNKGGSGKTSQCSTIAKFLANKGYKILLIDADMQGNLTQSTGLMFKEAFIDQMENINLEKAIKEEADIRDFILKTSIESIDIVPYHEKLAKIENDMFLKNAREHIFERMFEYLKKDRTYDFILIDVNPSLGILTQNAIDISDHCISPVYLGAFGVRTLPVLLEFLDEVKRYSSSFKSVKFSLNNYDLRKGKLVKNVENYLRNDFPESLFETKIPVDIDFEYAQLSGMYLDDYKYANKSKSSKTLKTLEAYESYIDELLTFLKGENEYVK